VTEAELFAAYRFPAGYTAQCACGSWIWASSAATTSDIAEAVRIHNQSPEHTQWSTEQEAVEALRQQAVHVCICHGKVPS
jgi:hypothetical protein